MDYFKAKKAISEETLESAKTELIQGIKDYDAVHSETEGTEMMHQFKVKNMRGEEYGKIRKLEKEIKTCRGLSV